MTINWTASGHIDHFEIIYNYTVNRCSDAGVPVVVEISDVSVRSHTLRGFNEDSNYTITISAINTAGSTMATTSVDTLTSGNADNVIVMCMH
jgi:predicted nuclease with TOPRIM domain